MQGTYRLNVDSGRWQRLAGGLPADIEVRSIVTTQYSRARQLLISIRGCEIGHALLQLRAAGEHMALL